MALAERLLNPPISRPGTPCSVGHLLNTLDQSEAQALQTMLDAGWSQDAIHAVVTEEGHHIGRQSIGRHRNHKCSCDQETT